MNRSIQSLSGASRWSTLFSFLTLLVPGALGLLSCSSSGVSAGAGGDRPGVFHFSVVGDMPYTYMAKEPLPILERYGRVLASIENTPTEFVVHVGDYTNGPYCGDSIVQVRYDEFNGMRHPFIFIFGDNDWTDCARGGFDPLERLTKLRSVFTQGDRSLGQRTIPLARQSSDPGFTLFRENVRWSMGDVLFVGLNIPGSNNNRGTAATPGDEYTARNAATLEWLRRSFAQATREGKKGIAIFIQANPGFERGLSAEDQKYFTGFEDFLRLLRELTAAYSGRAALIHGDSHYFRIDQPLSDSATGRMVANFTRAETFGAQNMHWLRVTVDPSDPNLFRFTPMIVPGNE